MSDIDVVAVRGLVKSYGGRRVVEGVDLNVGAGEIVGLIGANGAGKTTTVECVQGLRRPDAGFLRVLGLDPAMEADRLRVGEAVWLFSEAIAGMLHAGAAGFVLKGVPADELHRAVRAVAAGDAWLDPTVTARVLAVYRNVPTMPSAPTVALDQLTDRERDVLALIGQGLTNTEIAESLFIGEGTVKTHINHVFTNLDLRDRSAAIMFAYDQHLVPHKR